ncbi:hypothetical protein ScPMuIL_009784 [Solemya velum]
MRTRMTGGNMTTGKGRQTPRGIHIYCTYLQNRGYCWNKNSVNMFCFLHFSYLHLSTPSHGLSTFFSLP